MLNKPKLTRAIQLDLVSRTLLLTTFCVEGNVQFTLFYSFSLHLYMLSDLPTHFTWRISYLVLISYWMILFLKEFLLGLFHYCVHSCSGPNFIHNWLKLLVEWQIVKPCEEKPLTYLWSNQIWAKKVQVRFNFCLI